MGRRAPLTPPTLNKFTTKPMDTYLFEIQDAPGEIFDIEDLQEDDNEDQTFSQMLNSNYDF
jgi:hypothetical protein